MKNNFILLLIVFVFCNSVNAQITVDKDDFADAGDTARMSVAQYNALTNFASTGANYNWNFLYLDWQSQYVDEFLNPIRTGATYALTFPDLSISPYRSNLAKTADNPLTSLPILSSVFTDGYNFYYKNSSMYRQRGLGMKVSGFPTPIPMTHPDTLYHFPINYGDEDSAWSDYRVRVPNLGTYVHKQQRKNKVDGWGTLTTPFGTFDVLRVRTEIRGSDSLYIDTLGSGVKVNNDIQREYKWFGKDQKNPLLQINTQAGLFGQLQGFEFITRIIYRDSVRFLPTGIFEPAANTIEFSVFPNPSAGKFFIAVPQDINSATVSITDLSGRLLFSQSIMSTTQSIEAAQFAKGVYLVTLQSAEGVGTKRIVIE